MPRTASDLRPAERAFLVQLQSRALSYFLDNQTAEGLMLDRQRNFAPLHTKGWCSTATTGMGFIALALASAAPFRLHSAQTATARIRRGLTAALERLPHTHGIVPHFLDAASGAPVGEDQRSTIDSAWLIGGGLWAAAFLEDAELQDLARQLYDRVNWRQWTTSSSSNSGLLRHGADGKGRSLPCAWDRLNGETILLYLLAAGGDSEAAWPAACWSRLQPFFNSAAGMRFISADLGLFVFQYGFDLVDLACWQEPGGLDLQQQAALATEANIRVCRAAAHRFETYRRYWGLSAGDGPGACAGAAVYRCYAPGEPLDGTAHLTASLASIAHAPEQVLKNLITAQRETRFCSLGRYGFSSINVDRDWVGRDMVGIDAGAVVLSLDNFLFDNRVRHVFHTLPCVQRGLMRIGFTPRLFPAGLPLAA